MKRLGANHSLSSYALQLTILSACRTSETLGARFAEFGHGVWTIPTERKEQPGRRSRRVPISSVHRRHRQ